MLDASPMQGGASVASAQTDAHATPYQKKKQKKTCQQFH